MNSFSKIRIPTGTSYSATFEMISLLRLLTTGPFLGLPPRPPHTCWASKVGNFRWKQWKLDAFAAFFTVRPHPQGAGSLAASHLGPESHRWLAGSLFRSHPQDVQLASRENGRGTANLSLQPKVGLHVWPRERQSTRTAV